MKINRLKLKGWTGVKKGLDLDEIELDLSGLSGLIALSGKNGAGKTTILESLQPYRILASRSKALPWHVYTRDAIKELDFDFQGDNYQTKILIDADSGRQEGYLWKNGESLLDGKVRNYDTYIENLFGSKDLFFSSIFCAQNASKLSDLTTGKLKELFAEFLRLDQYIAYESTTKQCISLLGSQGTVYGSQADNIRDRLGQYDGDLQGKLSRAQAELESANETHARAMQEIVEVDAEIAKAKESIATNSALNSRLMDFGTRISTTEQAIQTEMADYENRVESVRAGVRTAKNEIHNLSQVLDQKDSIEQAVIRRKELAEKIEIKTDSINAEQRNISDLKDRVREKEKDIAALEPHPDEAKIPLLREQLRNLKAQTSDLDRRDPECSSTICGFIKTALQAERSLPGLEKQLDKAVRFIEGYNEGNEEIAEQATKEKTALQGKEKEASSLVSGLQDLLADHKKEYARLATLTEAQGDLRDALARKEAAKKREKELTAQGMGMKGDHARKVEGLKTELSGLKTTYAEILSQMDTDADAKVERLELGKREAERDKVTWDSRITDWMASIRAIETDITEKAVLEKELVEIESKGSVIQTQVSEWSYLRNALSKDGIRALEIDAVAPSISAYANQILFNTFGPAYSVKLRTQDDEGREVLDILAIEEDGKETMLDDLSGGEKCWSLKALRLAMTLIAKQKSGRQFLSAMADEEDGNLDTENAQNFIRLYRSFMDTGGFESCFFISHRPECVAMADHELLFGNGGISIN